ncbi:hypothetical protein R84B8_01580 [Treponema sp. R8-4-B8]
MKCNTKKHVLILMILICAEVTACKNNIMEEWWSVSVEEPATYTVTFNANGGTPAPAKQTVNIGGKATEPASMTKSGNTFGGWYKEAAFTNKWNFATNTVSADITLYAQWNPVAVEKPTVYTVTFNTNGGTPAPAQQTVNIGGKANEPAAMTKSGNVFGGWYKEAAFTNKWNFTTDTVSADITLYAQWNSAAAELYVNDVLQMQAKLPELLAWIKGNTANNTNYEIRLGENASLLPTEGQFNYPGKTGVNVSLIGTGAERTITLTNNAKGSLFEVGTGVTFVLNQNVTLKGHSENTSELVKVSSGGTMIMKDGATVRDNVNTSAPTATSTFAGGILVIGTLIIDGGTVVENKTNDCGSGVCVTGTFTMNGGSISNNKAIKINVNSDLGGPGGGVYVYGGTFTMNGGSISNNEAYGGGGIYIDGSTFTMNGGSISNNEAYGGGGIYIDKSTIIMNSGTVTGNKTTKDAGGGIAVYSGTFTMNGGLISENEAPFEGGGVVAYKGAFTMKGGVISKNKVTEKLSTYIVGGGGVYISATDGGGFTKTGGIIYGSDASGGLANTVVERYFNGGDAVFAYQGNNTGKVRNRTLYESDNISTTNWSIGWE